MIFFFFFWCGVFWCDVANKKKTVEDLFPGGEKPCRKSKHRKWWVLSALWSVWTQSFRLCFYIFQVYCVVVWCFVVCVVSIFIFTELVQSSEVVSDWEYWWETGTRWQCGLRSWSWWRWRSGLRHVSSSPQSPPGPGTTYLLLLSSQFVRTVFLRISGFFQ